MKAKRIAIAGLLCIAAGTALALGDPYENRVYVFPNEYTIVGGKLAVNGSLTHIPADLVGFCEDGSVWVFEKLPYPRNWRWGRIVRGNFTEDPLMSSVTVNWRASKIPEC